MNWIKHPIRLEGEKVILLPLEESHFNELISISGDDCIWGFMRIKEAGNGALLSELQEALCQRELGIEYPFVVIDKATHNIMGSTRYLKISEEHRNLEIGWTWYSPAYWGKGYNDECKLLLLTHCFETLDVIRVQIVAAANNVRSRKAIERIGGRFEGILRNALIRHNGIRSSAYYSILPEEWDEVKTNLIHLVHTRGK